MSDNDSKANETGAGIDLGLSSILESEGRPSVEEMDSGIDFDYKISKLLKDRNSKEKKDAPKTFSSIAAECSWEELSEFCEGKLGENGEESPEARLWWIKAQLELGSVPASILAAPLESVTKNIEDTELSKIASKLLARVAKKLNPDSDSHLILTFYQRANTLTAEYGKELIVVLDREIESLRVQLRRKKEEGLLEKIGELVLVREKVVGTGGVKNEEPQTVEKKESSSWFPLVAKGACLFIIIGLIFYVGKPAGAELFQFGSQPSEPYATLVLPSKAPKMILPSFERVKEVRRTSLKNILTDLDSSEDFGDPEVQQASLAANSSRRVVSAPVKKVSINTSTPIESAELRQIMSEYQATFDSNLPKSTRPKQKFAKAARISNDFVLKPREIVRGATKENPIVRGFGGRAPSGEESNEYIVISRKAVVRSGPAEIGTLVLSELQASDRVTVVGEKNRWLQVQIGKNEFGYLKAEDAIPLVVVEEVRLR